MDTRLSEEFQQHIRNFRKYYKPGTPIKKKHARKYGLCTIDYSKDYSREIAIQSAKYLLNFYEFLSVSIFKKDVDEEVLFECLSLIALSLYETCEPIIDNACEQDPLAYEHFKRLMNDPVKGWKSRGALKVAKKAC